jgi:hypothetical protein
MPMANPDGYCLDFFGRCIKISGLFQRKGAKPKRRKKRKDSIWKEEKKLSTMRENRMAD